MAYVPDDAMRCKRQITHSAWDVYEQLCAFGDAKTGIVEAKFAPNSKLVEWTGLKLGTIKNSRTELRKKGWIREDEGRIYLCVGTFLNELREQRRKASQRSSYSDTPSLHSDDSKSLPSLTSDAPSPRNDVPSSYSDTPSLHSDGDIYKDRARGSTNPDQPVTKPKTNTHTPRAREQTHAPPAAGVCVSPDGGSKFSRSILKRYAKANSLGRGWVTKAKRTGEWDEDVEEFEQNGGQNVGSSIPKRGFGAVLDRLQRQRDDAAPPSQAAGAAGRA